MSALEDQFFLQLRAVKLPLPEREYVFAPPRRWRSDFAWLSQKLLVEIEGGTWQSKSRHTSGKGFEGDCSKYNTAVLLGFRVLRFTSAMVQDGRAVMAVELALGLYGKDEE